MKLQLLSDTHGSPYFIDQNADLIVHLGDFGNGLKGAVEFHENCKKLGKPYVFVQGNHDFYHENMTEVYRKIQDLGLNCLFEHRVFEFDGWSFVGGTLFTNFRQNTVVFREHEKFKLISERCIADFGYIFDYQTNEKSEKRITGNDYVRFFNHQLNWINRFRGKDKTVVLTHFPPSLICQDPQFDSSPLNPYFINDINLEGFKFWFSGHTHSAIDTVFQGCRVVINPLGYPNEQGKNGFISDLLIEL